MSRRKTGHLKVDHYPDNCNYLDKDAREMRVFVNRPIVTLVAMELHWLR